jgi:hypothetical protein
MCVIGIALFLFSGCATTGKPWYDEFNTYPVVVLGDPVPEGQKFVLHIPAGKPVPTVISFRGNLLEKETEEEVTTVLKKDIYLHRAWISFDRKTWRKAEETVDIEFEPQLTDYYHPGPGSIKIRIDQK